MAKVLGKAPSAWRAEMARWSDGGIVEQLDDATVGGWRVDDEARILLSEVGLPAWDSFFARCPQEAGEPLYPPFYILGREVVEEHQHEPFIDLRCGCGYFGLSAADGGVWQVFGDGGGLPVNTTLALFYYFLDKVAGSSPQQNSDIPERQSMKRAETVMRRLIQRDPILTSGADNFWGYVFDRPWG
ncbi:hypothetical protein BJ973_004113 [Actinoplanes tereljensis]|uniref:Uncharacterized protein n=1 Tax=Paractinoplanes tereljensis TaxID=571912 RepID=A0A919NSG2_9ACTN|nr:SUKH-4 family immunity protein [Actinoplanes tereljensis]GIF23503.1 hypothetical protein Ate02nite_62330 [Actinoplanes tereljensis]